MARYMKTSVPGMDVPEGLIKRLNDTPKDEVADEGIKICLEIIEQVRTIKGIAGIHIMAIEWEHKVPEIIEAAGLYPRPS